MGFPRWVDCYKKHYFECYKNFKDLMRLQIIVCQQFSIKNLVVKLSLHVLTKKAQVNTQFQHSHKKQIVWKHGPS